MDANLNSQVVVKLTPYGEAVLAAWHSLLGSPLGVQCTPMPDGSYSFKLWELMNIFGSVLYRSNGKIPFVNSELTIME